MEILEIPTFEDSHNSLFFFLEKEKSGNWHYHPLHELVLVKKGEGIRIIGDHKKRFRRNELVLIGPNLPHIWKFDDSYYSNEGNFLGERLVIQFSYKLLNQFLCLPENRNVNTCLENSKLGCCFPNNCKKEIISLMIKMQSQDLTERFYTLLSIFKVINAAKEFKILSSPSVLKRFSENINDHFNNAVQFLHQNFHNEIRMKEMLEISNMSNTTFFITFKNKYRMSFKQYLLNLRISYACRLLDNESLTVSEIAFKSGFNNLANFHRRFKQLKNCTPNDYKKQNNPLLSHA